MFPADGPEPSHTDLRAVAVIGDLHLAVGVEETCLKGSLGQDCRITLRRWWLLPASFDWASGLQWLPAGLLFESRCGPALHRPCPETPDLVGPLAVAASDASAWSVAGTIRGEGGLGRGLLLWRR